MPAPIIEKPDNMTLNDWEIVSEGISKRYDAYGSQSVYKLPDEYEKKLREQIVKYKEDIKKAPCLLHNDKLKSAVELLETQMLQVEQRRHDDINKLMTDYDKELEKFFNKYKDKRRHFGVGGYELAEKSLDHPRALVELKNNLKQQLEYNIADINKKYTLNSKYAEHMQLLASGRFIGQAAEGTEAIVTDFKKNIKVKVKREQEIPVKLEELKIKVAKLKENTDELMRRHAEMEKDLKELHVQKKKLEGESIELDASANDAVSEDDLATLATKRKNNKAQIAEVKLKIAKLDATVRREITNPCLKNAAHMQNIFRGQMTLRREKMQLHAQFELEKRQALGLVPPQYADFLQEYKTMPLQDFVAAIRELSGSVNGSKQPSKEQADKLHWFASDIIAKLPTLGMPDVAQNGKLIYSEENKNDIIKAFIVLDEANKAAKQAAENEPDNLYLRERHVEIEHGFNILSNKILVHPKIEAVMGFELLSKDQQRKYYEKTAALNLEAENGRQQAMELNVEIARAVDQVKFATAKEELDAELEKMGAIGTRLKQEENLPLYSGLINHQVVMKELQTMANRLTEYLASDDFSDKDELRQQKEKELDQIKLEMDQMQKVMTTDLGKVLHLLGVNRDQQSIIDAFTQEASHYMTKMLYTAGGAVAGYGIGSVAGMVCSVLGSSTGYGVMNTVGSVAPYVGIAGGALIGYKAGELATQYDDNNISKVLSADSYEYIKKQQKIFAPEARDLTALYTAAETKFKNIKDNYIDAFKQTKSSWWNKAADWAKNHKGIVMAGLVAVGVVISAATFGAAAPFFVGAGVAVAAAVGVASVGVGVAGSSMLGLYVYSRVNKSEAHAIHTNAVTKMATVADELQMNADFETMMKEKYNVLKPGEESYELARQVDAHLKEQFILVSNRIKSYDPALVNSPKLEDEFKSKMMRELHCLENMRELQAKLNESLQKINDNMDTNPYLATAAQDTLKRDLRTYLDQTYNLYHKTHIVDDTAALQVAEKSVFSDELKAKGGQRAKLVGTRKDYVTFQYDNDASAASADVTKLRANLAEADKQVKIMGELSKMVKSKVAM